MFFNMLTSETNKRKRQEDAASTGRKAKTRRGRGGEVIRCGLICVFTTSNLLLLQLGQLVLLDVLQRFSQ